MNNTGIGVTDYPPHDQDWYPEQHDDYVVSYTNATRIQLFTAIQALRIYLRHDGQMQLTRNGSGYAVVFIEDFLRTTFPRNGRGQRLRRERIALANALVIWAALGFEAPSSWPTLEEVAAEIPGEWPLAEITEV